MSAFPSDELPRRKNSRPRDPVITHPLLQTKCHLALRTDVAHAGNSALQKIAELFHGAQRRVGLTRRMQRISFGQRIRQVRVQIDQSGRMVLPATSTTSAFFGQSVDEAGKIFEILLRSMISVPSWAALPVPSKILPPRKTSVRSGPIGPGFTGIRRGSSLT